MKQVILTTLLLIAAFSSNAQDISKLEKHAEKIVEAIQSGNKESYKKLIISEKDYIKLTSHLSEIRNVVKINTDSLYPILSEKSINSFTKKTEELKESEIVLKEVSHQKTTYNITNENNEVRAEIEITLNTYKGDKTLKIKYIYFNKKWLTMGELNASPFDIERICDCVSKMQELSQESECMKYLNSLEPLVKELNEEERDMLMKKVEECMPKYDVDVYDDSAEEVITEDTPLNEELNISFDRAKQIDNEIEKELPNICDCFDPKLDPDNPSENCKKLQAKYDTFINSYKDLNEQEYVMNKIMDCINKYME